MDNKEAIAVLKSNYPHGRIVLSEAVDLSIKALEAMELVPTPNNARDEICPHFYSDRIPVGDSDTHFERISCCRTSGKLSPVA